MYFSEHKNGTNIDKEFGDKKDNKSYLKWIVLILIFLVGATILYFLLNKKDNIAMQKNEIFLTLNGNTDVILYQNDTYIDPGYKAYDSKGNDLTSNVTVSGSVDTTKAGDYIVTYTLDEIIKERHISVIAKTSQKTYLILEGESTIFLKVGEEYKEPGYTVIDASETGLESKVNVSGNIGTTAGTYKLKYSVTNKSGETVSVERTIIVMDSDIGISYTPEEKTNGKVKIIVNIVDNYYDYIVLPDNSKKSERYITYEVSENGTYKFIIYSKNGEKKEKEITINNIYKNPPSGTCEATVIGNNTAIKVNVTSNIEIKKYKYNNEEFKSNTFTVKDNNSPFKVTIYDIYDNYKEINCKEKYIFDTNFKEITTSKTYTPCNNDWTKENNELKEIVEKYGYKTRDAVAASATYLANFKYKVAYSWGGKSVSPGINPNWGCTKSVTKNVCSEIINSNPNNLECMYGMDCTGYTSWAYAQAGFDKSILRTSSQSTGMWGNFDASKHKYSFLKNQDKVKEIKPGDIVHTEGHVGIVIGINETQLQVANMHEGIRISYINKSNGKSTNGDRDFDNFVLFDDFFKQYRN